MPFPPLQLPMKRCVFFRLTGIHKKNVELSLMLVPRCKGLRIAHLSWNRATFTTPRWCKKYDGLTGWMMRTERRQGAEAVRRMQSIMLTAWWMLTARFGEVFTPHRALPCLGRDRSVKLRSSTASVPKRSENAFYMYVPPMQWRAGRPHMQDGYCKFTIYFLNSSLFMKKIKKKFISPEKRKQER